METIRVNMTPCEDIKTIHASQNDNEAREWGFELHNNGDKIDSSSISDQLVFKAYEGGTEQILPENGSTPTTSPFKGDIKYPQGLLSDQEFLYRESPTEEDGLAKITDIKGNTLNWNQLMENGNFADTSKWSAESGATLSISNNIATISSTTANNGIRQYFSNPLTVNHKYLIKAEFNVPTEYRCVIGTAANQGVQTDKLISTANTWTEVIGIGTCTVATTTFYCFVRGTTYENVKVRNVMCFDITAMGLDISSPSDFTSLFSLPYYAYNQGTLLSFIGNGIKTVGFNQWDEEWELGSINNDTGQNSPSTSTIRSKNYFSVLPNKEYYLHASVASTFNYRFYDADKRFISGSYIARNNTLLIPNGVAYMRFYLGSAYGTIYNNDICINISDTERNGEYEPYTSSTLSLPISTYFSNGMKSAGSVYDEKTNSSYVERTAYIKFDGSQTWSTRTTSGGYVLYEYVPSDIKNVGTQATAQISNNLYPWNTTLSENKTIRQVNTTISVRRDDITSLQAWYSELASNPLEVIYQLATPIETEITTASLVTENTEIPLSNEDGVLVGKCTEQLSSESGFFDAKIKLTDTDGECYSNKIQLHIERSPL